MLGKRLIKGEGGNGKEAEPYRGEGKRLNSAG